MMKTLFGLTGMGLVIGTLTAMGLSDLFGRMLSAMSI